MKKLIKIIIVFAFFQTSCVWRTRDLVIDRQVKDYLYVGHTAAYYSHGVWGKVAPTENYNPTTTEYRLIFKNPDSIAVGTDYVLLIRKSKYCLIMEENDSLIDTRKDILKTRDKELVDSLIKARNRIR